MATVSQRNEIARMFVLYILKLEKSTAKFFARSKKPALERVESVLKNIDRNTDTSLFWKEIEKRFTKFSKEVFVTQKSGGVWGVINFLIQIERSSKNPSSLYNIINGNIMFSQKL